MVVDVGRRLDDRLDRRVRLVAEIRSQNLDRGGRRVAPQRLDDLHELTRAAIGKIVPVHGRHDDMLKPQLGRRYRRSEEHTSELQSLMRISYAVFSWYKNRIPSTDTHTNANNTHK